MLLEDHSILLLPDSSLLINSAEGTCLVAADLHLGRSAAFRAKGLPLPDDDAHRDLERLSSLIAIHSPSRLVVAGDLFHAGSERSDEFIDLVHAFLKHIGIPFTLTTGNQDSKLKHLPEFLNPTSFLDIAGIRIVHKPTNASPVFFNICGHIHPVLKIKDGKNTSLRLPSFHLRENILTLPAFGSFTGGHVVKPQVGDRFFITHQGEVVEVPTKIFLARI